MTLAREGAQRFDMALDGRAVDGIRAVLSCLPADKAGIRLKGIAALNPYLAIDGPVGGVAAAVLGADAKPVRAILFDKTPRANWKLTWHQDRTIAVRQRIEVEGYGPWSTKAGLLHVVPPFALLAEMVTLRVHLDPVGIDNGPLLIAPGSHRLGRIAEPQIDDAAAICGTVVCLAEAGDVWAYATPILHASEAALAPSRRRVLQIDYSASDLPGGLEWLGV
jgi:hypothetical protein